MKKFATLFGVALMAGTALCAAKAYAGDELTITSWGGAYSESQRKAFFEPFIAAGNKITEAEYRLGVQQLIASMQDQKDERTYRQVVSGRRRGTGRRSRSRARRRRPW